MRRSEPWREEFRVQRDVCSLKVTQCRTLYFRVAYLLSFMAITQAYRTLLRELGKAVRSQTSVELSGIFKSI